jgi:hypothetical protein
MRHRTFDLAIDWLLVAAGALAFGTGLALFFGFHVGHGFARDVLWGLGRAAWLDVHRLAAIATAAGMAAHIASHLRPLASWLRRSLRSWPGRHAATELALCLTFPLMVLAGFVAWLALGGADVAGAQAVGPRPHDVHHAVIDVHNISGLVALTATVLHLRPRWRRLVGRSRRRYGDAPADRCEPRLDVRL